MRAFYFIALFPLAVALAGCPSESSSSIATDALYVSYRVVKEGDLVEVRAEFHVGNALGTSLELDGGDEIRVNGTVLSFRSLLIPHYEGTVQPADNYTFEFIRTGEGTYSSTVGSPASVIVTSPDAGSVLSRSTSFLAEWTDPDSTGEYFVGVSVRSENCSLTVGVSVDGATSYAFTPEDFTSPPEEAAPTGKGEPVEGGQPICEGETLVGELHIESITRGTLAPELSGSITSRVSSPIEITLTP